MYEVTEKGSVTGHEFNFYAQLFATMSYICNLLTSKIT